MSHMLADPYVRRALLIGLVVAVVSGPVGVFTILRGQSFAGHALADTGTVGGAGAYLLGTNVLAGFVSVNILAAALMEWAGARRARSRDVATGIVLGAALGISALLLHLETATSTSSATNTVLFGSLFAVRASLVPYVAVSAFAALSLLAVLYRPLLLSSVSPELAAARGVPVGLVGLGYLVCLAVAVSLSAVSIGAILSTALLIGPAAAALSLTRRPGAAIALSALLGVVATGGGIVLAYASYYWSAEHHAWPVSFFVVAIVMAMYLVARIR